MLRKWLISLILILSVAVPVAAQNSRDDIYRTFEFTLQSGATATGNGTAAACPGLGSGAFTVTISNTATVTFEGSGDGTNYASMRVVNMATGAVSTTATASGTYLGSLSGMKLVRARISAYTSGTVTVTMRGSLAHVNPMVFSAPPVVGAPVSGATVDTLLYVDSSGNLASATRTNYSDSSASLTLKNYSDPSLILQSTTGGGSAFIYAGRDDWSIYNEVGSHSGSASGTTMGVSNNGQGHMVQYGGPLVVGTNGSHALTLGTNNTASMTISASTQDVSLNSNKITSLADPSDAQDAATKAYVDANAGGAIAQIVETRSGAVATGTGTVPGDDTIPQNTEGDEYLTVSITPTNASSTLYVEAQFNGSNDNATASIIACIFRDSDADALGVSWHRLTGATHVIQLNVTASVSAGSTSATTFKMRVGSDQVGSTTTFNGVSGGRFYGGKMASFIRVTEILP